MRLPDNHSQLRIDAVVIMENRLQLAAAREKMQQLNFMTIDMARRVLVMGNHVTPKRRVRGWEYVVDPSWEADDA